MNVVLLSGDLMVVSRVQGAAARVGSSVRAVASALQAVEYCVADGAEMLIVDLSTTALDVHALISQLKSDSAETTRVVAFGPHVHEERLAAAREAGCDRVMSRGQFFAEIDRLVSG